MEEAVTLMAVQHRPCDICGQTFGGSHYHCAQCNDPKPTSMYGHYTHGVYFGGRWMPFALTETIDTYFGPKEVPRGVFSCQPEYDEALASVGLERVDGRIKRVAK